MGDKHILGDLQHAIMRVLWKEGEATVSRVQEALEGDRDRALTTIATMLVKMEKKGIVSHRSEGRQFVYRASVSETDVQRSMVSDLTEMLFGGDVTALVSHLLTEQEIDSNELKKLRSMIAEHGSKERRRGR